MDKTIRKYRNLNEMKADEYRYWQSRPSPDADTLIGRASPGG